MVILGSAHSQKRYTGTPGLYEDLWLHKFNISGSDLVPLYPNDVVQFWWKHNAKDTAMWLPSVIPSLETFYHRADLHYVKELFTTREDEYDARR